MGDRIAAFDWSTTSLGPLATWPSSLKAIVSLLVRSPVAMVLLWGEEGVMLYNDAYSVFAGGRHPDLLGKRVVSEGWTEVADFNANVLRVGLAGGTLAYKDQELTLHRSGRPEQVWMDLDYSPVPDESGRPAGVIAIVIETTERVASERRRALAEAATRREAERVQLALDAGAIIGTWVWDVLEDRFTADDRFAASFDLEAELCRTGIPIEQVTASIHPDDRTQVEAAIAEALERGGRYCCEYRVRQRDDSYGWIEANGHVELSPDGRASRFPGVLLDISARKRAESELRELNDTLEQRIAAAVEELARTEEALRQSQKMEAVGQLTGGIAHDFNNLLIGITGSLELIQKRVRDQGLAGFDRHLGIAQASAQRAAALTQRLLAFSRRQTLDPKPLDVNRLVQGVEDLIRRTVGPSIVVEVVGAIGLWVTKVDAPQLENALLNLAINARDAMPDGGRLTIETANKWIDGHAAKDRDLTPGQYISLCVTDTGTGMTPEVTTRAFDPFFTTQPLGRGTGLGLSMIHGFARQSGGQVRIYTELGQGTTMCLYFPRFAGGLDADSISKVEDEIERSSGETVLVIDDEEPIRMLITDVLEEAGYRVLEAADGPSGLKVLQSDARIDLLITDVGLPGGFNGRQVADAARQTRPGLKVLFVTGYAENAVVGNGHLDVGMQVITKPFPMTTLSVRVREIIES